MGLSVTQRPSRRIGYRLPRPTMASAVDRFRSTMWRLGGAGWERRVQTTSWPLATDLSSVTKARRLVRDRLTGWRLEGMSDVVELLVSELVTNALLHAPGPCRLILYATDGLLRCEVEDRGTRLPRLREIRDHDESGRRLHLLDMLACCWGCIRTPDGKAVWFELPIGPEQP